MDPILVQLGEDFFDLIDQDVAPELSFTNINSNTPAPLQEVRVNLSRFNNPLKIGHLNASSVPKHIAEITRILKYTELDILAITESFIKDDTPEHRTQIKGYNLIKVNRTTANQGGLCLYVRQDLKIEQIEIEQDANYPELMCALITVNNTKIAVAVLYKRPSVSYKRMNHVMDHLTHITCSYNDTIIMGDINIDMLNKNKADYKYFHSNIIHPLSLTQVIDKPTRITEDSSRCIDVILINNENKCLTSGVTPTYSDHHLVYMAYDLEVPKTETKKVTRRDMKNFSAEKFIEDVSQTPWHAINEFQERDVDNKVSALENMMNTLIDKHAPYKTYTYKDQPMAAWMDKDLLKKMDERDKLLDKANKTGKKEDRLKFKRYRNHVSHLQRKAKKKYYNKVINMEVNNSQKFFDNLKKNNIIEDKKKKNTECNFSATKLNQAFLLNNNAKEDTDKVNEEIGKILQKSTNVREKFTFKDITEEEIKKIIKSLKSSSCGVDGITAKFVKLAANYIAKPLVNIINSSFIHKTFPERWKRAIVKPIPKTACPKTESEYRPISLLPVFSKIHEKYATAEIIKYLRDENLLDKYQSAYKPNHSTITALLNITDDIYDALDDSELTILVLIDYSKAFDTINHRILYAKLKALGFHRDAIAWVVGYLTERKQKVKTSSDESGWEYIQNGVPQGSVIGPLLFSIMVHDISQATENCNYHMYADDTQAYKRSTLNDINETIELVNNDLEKISDFSSRTCLRINETKSYYIILGSTHQIQELRDQRLDDIKINGKAIKRETCVKNLGIEFDEHLTWESQISKQVKNAYFKLKQLYRFKNFLSEKCKARLIETFVLSQLNYGNTVTQNITKEQLNRLQLVQNACYRFIYSVRKFDHISPYINNAKCLNMENRTKYHGLVLMHKIITGKAPEYLRNRITYRRDIHSRNTRYRNLIHIPRLKKCVKKGAFFQKTTKEYNNLITQKIIAEDMPISSFKIKCKKHLLDVQTGAGTR